MVKLKSYMPNMLSVTGEAVTMINLSATSF